MERLWSCFKKNNVDCQVETGNKQQSPVLKSNVLLTHPFHTGLIPVRTLSLYNDVTYFLLLALSMLGGQSRLSIVSLTKLADL